MEEGVEVTEQVINFPKPLAFGDQGGTLSAEQGDNAACEKYLNQA